MATDLHAASSSVKAGASSGIPSKNMSAEQLEKWRKEGAPIWGEPPMKGHKIEGYRYHSKDFFDDEWENMWTKTWLLLGRANEIPEPGDYQMEEVGPESILMVRQPDQSIKAFYNVCQHRGARLVFNDIGFTDELTCPYHGWGWQLDGSLTRVQDPEDFPEGDPCGKLTLEEVKSEVFAGFIWVNMDPDAEPLKDYLGAVWDDWSMYEMDDWKRYVALTCNAPVNWKVVLDNFNESYHLPTVHPQVADRVEDNFKYTQFDMSPEGHGRMWMRAGAPSRMLLGTDQPLMNPGLEDQLQRWDLDAKDFEGREFETREAIQQKMRELGPERGYHHFANLRDHQLTDTYHYFLFPNFAVSVWADGFHFLRATPHPTDPTKCVFDNWWYAPVPNENCEEVRTILGPMAADAECDHRKFEYGEESMGVLIDQDMGVTKGQQLGFRSRGYKGVYLSHQEFRIRRYHEVIDEYISGERPHGERASKIAAE